jgi:hypothetical protein
LDESLFIRRSLTFLKGFKAGGTDKDTSSGVGGLVPASSFSESNPSFSSDSEPELSISLSSERSSLSLSGSFFA